jgi:hypothetical protein
MKVEIFFCNNKPAYTMSKVYVGKNVIMVSRIDIDIIRSSMMTGRMITPTGNFYDFMITDISNNKITGILTSTTAELEIKYEDDYIFQPTLTPVSLLQN